LKGTVLTVKLLVCYSGLKWIETLYLCCIYIQNTCISAVHIEILFFGINLQAEKESYMKKLEKESKLLSQLKYQVSIADTKEQEIHELHQQLTNLQVLC